MNQKAPVDREDIIFFLEVLSKYCVFYFGEEEGTVLYNYYHDNHGDVIAVIKKGKRVYGAKLPKLDMIFRKINIDVFFDQTEIYHVRWPYDKGEVKQVDFELFDLTCFNFYETLGESKTSNEEKLKLGFSRRILDLLLPPQKDCLFNRDERFNSNMARLEQLYAELKKRSPDILKEYGKNFWQLTHKEFSAYLFHLDKTPQQLINVLWYRIKED